MLPATVIVLLASSGAKAQLPTVVTGGDVFVYATFVSPPGTISFDAFDNMFVGNFNNPGPPNGPAPVWVVDAEDSTVSTCATIDDPDAVYIDRNGLLSLSGTLLVGGLISPTTTGQIRGVTNCGGSSLLASGGCVHNVRMFAEDALGNLYVANATSRTICRWNGATWAQFLPAFPLAGPIEPAIAIDGTDVYVSAAGVVKLYDTSGAVVDPAFAVGEVVGIGPFATAFEGVIVSRADSLELVAVDPDTKRERPILTGPGSPGVVAFDSAGDLYVAQDYANRVLHVTQPIPTHVPGVISTRTCTLYQNVPNPFNPTTTIQFEIPRSASTQLDVFDVSGRHVRSLLRGMIGKGPHAVTWDGTNHRGELVGSGVYFYRLEVGGERLTRKMVLLK
ncbi:MAG TPA: T9SS type A sorting domain-containing protein [Candidatus Krumholzibacteria bacterium]|nr:T9SS type A sorting domain-containing protein [Candidatus Krumholzibacteria bacterium]